MDLYRKWVANARIVFSGKEDPKNILAYSISYFMSRTYVWFNTSEFKKTSLANRLVHLTLMALVYVAYILVVYHTVSNPVTQENLIDVCMNIGMFVGGSTCWIRFILNWRNRAKITNVVETINVKVQVAKGECSATLLENWRYNYWMLFRVAAIAYVIGFALSMVVFLYPILSGKHFLVMWNSENQSLAWWVHVVLAGVAILFCATYYTLSDVQVLDCVIQLTFLYSVEYEKIPRISTSEEIARTQIINLYKELLSLKTLTTGYLEVVRFYKLYLWTIAYIALAVLCVAFLVSTDDGLLSRSRLVLYPFYFLCLLAVWGFAGTHFEESAGQLNWMIYSCDWTEMTVKTRKLLILLMFMGQNRPCLEVPPFYVLNRVLFASLLQKTFSFFAVVRNMLK